MKLYQLAGQDFVDAVAALYKSSVPLVSEWRKEARECYRFEAGHQWDDTDLAMLEEQRRPAVVFNRVGKIVDAVSGSEIVQRQQVRYLPRTSEDMPQTEVWNAAAKWVRDQTDAEDEESDAFRDTVVSGMGWVETFLDYEREPDGMVREARVDPLEMRWDPSAKARNLTDAQWIMRERWVSRDEIDARWPKKGADLQPEQETMYEEMQPHDAENAWRYGDGAANANNAWKRNYNASTREYRVIELQWYELRPFYRALNPETGEIEEFEEDEAEQARQYEKRVKQHRRKFYRAWVAGNRLLAKELNLWPQGYTYCCITGKRDTQGSKASWYGLMRPMRDPQRFANKFFSSTLHIFNSTPKGAFFYETGALKDPVRAREDMNKPEGMVEVNAGALSGGRIQERAIFNIPANVDRMLEQAVGAIQDVSGVNLEFLGLTDRDQPGVLEATRQRQAFGILSVMFDSLRRFRKLQGRCLLYLMSEFLTDGRIVRVVGPEGERYVNFVARENIDFDIIVDQSPTTPNARTEAMMVMQQMLPVLVQAGFPIIPDIIDYMPLPLAMIEKWKQAYQDPRMEQLMQQMQALQSENYELRVKAQERMQQEQTKQAKVAMEDDRDRERIEIEREQAITDRMKTMSNARSSLDHHDLLRQTEVREALMERARLLLESQKLSTEQYKMIVDSMETLNGGTTGTA